MTISKGDRVANKRNGKIGTATQDEYIAYGGRPAVIVRWDGSKRVPVPSFTENLTKI